MLSDTDMKCRPIYRIVKGKFKSIECGLKMLMDFFFLVLSKKNEFRYSFNLFIRCMRDTIMYSIIFRTIYDI